MQAYGRVAALARPKRLGAQTCYLCCNSVPCIYGHMMMAHHGGDIVVVCIVAVRQFRVVGRCRDHRTELPPSPSDAPTLPVRLPARPRISASTHKRHEAASPDEQPSPGKRVFSLLEDHREGRSSEDASNSRNPLQESDATRSWFPRIYSAAGHGQSPQQRRGRGVWPETRLILALEGRAG